MSEAAAALPEGRAFINTSNDDKVVVDRRQGALYVGRTVVAFIRIEKAPSPHPTFHPVLDACTRAGFRGDLLKTKVTERWAA